MLGRTTTTNYRKKTAKNASLPIKAVQRGSSVTLREDPLVYRAKQPRFIDLFCGIGGFRIAFEKQGAKCVFSSDYDCCVSGINVPRLLVASHIKPWKSFPKERLDPSNGLCLSSLHDVAFDSGLVTFDEEFAMLISPRLRNFLPQESLEINFFEFEGKPIRMPDKIAAPSGEFLYYHREHIFQKK